MWGNYNMRVVFFGTGAYAKVLWEQIEDKPELYKDEYVAFSDNNRDLWGQEFYGRKIIEPDNISNRNVDLIIIATTYYENVIRKQLTQKLGIPKSKIYIWDEYKRLCYARKVYEKRYGAVNQDKKYTENPTKSMVVYTAITGDYDSLKSPLFVDENLTYVCFTNNRNIKSKIWNVEYIENNQMDDVHLARHVKLNPHLFFSEYEMSVWVDGKYQIMDDLRSYVAKYQKHSGILCFPHPERSCICDEAATCIMWTQGNKKDMIIQIGDYLKEGYPLNYGLYETGCMVRFHNDASVKILMNEWEKQITKYSFRDQLSFPYICWRNGFIPDICDLDINRNQWLLQRRTLYKLSEM